MTSDQEKYGEIINQQEELRKQNQLAEAQALSTTVLDLQDTIEQETL
jgi:hypothetical protein